jgi:N utilization substance protein B
MNRRKLREHIFKLVFTIIDKYLPEENIVYYFEDNKIEEGAPEIKAVTMGIVNNLHAIDAVILEHTKGYTFARISKVCLAVMRVAIYEILFLDSVPNSVAISEAMEIASKYEDEKSKAFVNGVLGAFVKSESRAGQSTEDSSRGADELDLEIKQSDDNNETEGEK